jgi:glycine/D-amino acid oxidase-like deaminating enzyme
MSVAYELAKAGKDVVIIDRGPIGKGMTSRTTAHLTAQCDDGFDQLISPRGEETARLWSGSQAACIDRIEANQKALGIDILIVGGADHKSGEADDADSRFLALEAWMRDLLPDLGNEMHRWSGQIQDTIDYCGFIVRNPGEKRTFICTGDSGQGVTHGAVAGMLISDLILNGESPWKEVYNPARKPIKAAGTFVSENVTVARNFAEYAAPGELSSWNELKPGQGAIVRKGLSKVAAFRDDNGKLFLRRLHASRMPSPLEQFRALLGLSLPRLAVPS